MFKDLKEDMNQDLNEDWEKHSRYKSRIDSLEKIRTETKLEMKNLGCQIKASVISLTNRSQVMGERISGLEDR